VLEAPVAPVERPEQYRFAAEVGFNAYNRGFDYLGARVPDLRAYYLPMLALLTARLELFPFASAQGLHSWPGLELAASVAPWLRSAPPGSTESVPTFTSREDIALQWRFSPTGRLPLTLAPLVGFRHYVFAVTGLAPSGASLTGLPNLTYLAGRVGLAAELPFKERFVAFAKLYGMPIFSASQLIGPQYFPTGAAFGLEASGGAGVRLTRSLEARLSLDWTRYMFFFNTNIVTSRYYAGGAADQYLGATLVLRYFM
jgi:hypothetical protein